MENQADVDIACGRVQVDVTDSAGRVVKVPAVRWRRPGDHRILPVIPASSSLTLRWVDRWRHLVVSWDGLVVDAFGARQHDR